MKPVQVVCMVAVLFYFSTAPLVNAQQYAFDTKRLAPLLSQHTIYSITQDRYGLMWIATQDGLNVFNGYEVKHFRNVASDSLSLIDNFTFSIIEDADGDIWVGTRSGLSVYIRSKGIFIHPHTSLYSKKYNPQSYVGLAASKDKRTIALVYNGALFRVDAGKTKASMGLGSPLYQADCRQPVFDTLGALWFTDGDSLRVINPSATKGKGMAAFNGTSHALYLHPSGSLFICSDSSLFLYSTENALIRRMTLPSPMQWELRSLSQGQSSEDIWVGGQYGISILTPSTGNEWGVKQLLMHDPFDESSLPESKVFSLFRERSENMWIGTSQHGVSIQSIDKGMFSYFTHKASGSPTLSSSVVWCVVQLQDGRYAIGTTNGFNIAKIDRSRGVLVDNQVVHLSDHELAGLSVFTMLQLPDEALLLGTQRGLFVYTLSNQTYKRIEYRTSPCTLKIMGMAYDSVGRIWLATSKGFHLYHHLKQVVTPLKDSLPMYTETRHSYCQTLYAASKNTMWVGSTAGFSCLDIRTGSTLLSDRIYFGDSAPSMPVSAFQLDTLGRMWVSTFGKGVYVLSTGGQVLHHFEESRGICNNVVYGFLKDNQGQFWLPTNNGLMRMHPYTFAQVTYTREDGLPTNEFSQNGMYRDEDHYLWFGSTEGLIMQRKQANEASIKAYTPVLTGLELNYIPVKPGAVVLGGLSLESLRLLKLDFNHKVLSFEFATSDVASQASLSYEYMLKGFDRTWAMVSSNRRLATYSNLPPGRYVFRVRSVYEKYRQSPQELQVELVVTPPFWLTLWFQVSLGILLMIAAGVLGRFLFTRKLRLKNNELAVIKEVQEERERISRDLHDHVGAQITYMIAKLDHLHYKIPDSDSLSQKLEVISQQARATMQMLRETIWAIHKEHISLHAFHQKIEEFLNSALSGLEGITYQIHFEADRLYVLKPVKALNLFRITQEAVTNAIKYSEGNALTIEIRAFNEMLTLSIHDNGKGFQKNAESTPHMQQGIGLKNMRERAVAADAQLSFFNTNGAHVELRTTVYTL